MLNAPSSGPDGRTRLAVSPAPSMTDADAAMRGGGVNVIGFFHAEFGQGEVARRLVTGLEQAGVPVATVTLREIPHRYIPHRQDHPFTERGGEPVYDVNILCVNAEHLPMYAETTGREVLKGRHTVAVWFWETSRFPEELHPAFDAVDEIWVASEYVADAIAAETWKPVLRFPLPVDPSPPPAVSRAELGLPPDEFVFLNVFDFYSTIERKNPLGLIDAFKRAFSPASGTQLLVKTINGDKRRADFERVLAAADEHPDVRIADGFVDPVMLHALVAHADSYVSLHRSEGFGLTIAEAMALGKPAVATGYSGNLTFMNEANSFLVPYELTRLEEACGPYPAGSVWAEPDVEAAAALLRVVCDDAEEAATRARRARESVRERHSVDEIAAFAAGRLRRIERLRRERAMGNTPAHRLAMYLERGPRVDWEAPSRFGWLGRAYRRLLLRALRPYIVRQREFELVVAEGFERSDEADRQHRDRVELLEDSVRHVSATADRLAAELSDARERLERLSDEQTARR